MKTTTILCGLLLCASLSSYAQSNELTTKLVLAQDDMRLKNYRDATHSLHWLMTNAPEHRKAIYIMAYKAYERAATASADATEKAQLLDSMLISYQLKEQFYGLSDLEKNNLAFRYYKYFRKDPSKYEDGLKRYQDVYASPQTVVNNNLASYMSMIRLFDQKTRKLSVDEIMEAHKQVTDVIASKLEGGEDATKMERNSAMVDQLFYQLIDGRLTCEYLSDMSADLNKGDLDMAKKVMAWSLDAGCTQEAFFTKAVEIAVEEEPNAGMMKILAQKAAAAENYEQAVSWYEKSLPLLENDTKRAATYMDIAKIYALQENKPQARTSALKSAELDGEMASAAYSFVANLYMSSFDDCAEGYSHIDDRAIFMAAYDMYQKAGDTQGMQNAFAQFPTKSQIHSENYTEGTVIDVGCWIQGKTKLRGRPSN